MPTYYCRWPNGDLSLVSGKSRSAIEDVLDEVGDPGCVELIPVQHAVAVHFALKASINPGATVPD